jgi:PPK2 family polyphosphate:nucleotide phosphotransferase
VFSGVNPAGFRVHAFGRPSELELRHDFLQRVAARLPERGKIGIFNRSHYEEVLVVRVHPAALAAQNLPDAGGKGFWEARFESIREFEQHLARNGTVVVKFWLNVSRREQKKRLLERIEDPEKNWKFRLGDLDDRALWDDYQAAYEAMLRATSRPHAPWYAIPADDKDYMRAAVATIGFDQDLHEHRAELRLLDEDGEHVALGDGGVQPQAQPRRRDVAAGSAPARSARCTAPAFASVAGCAGTYMRP